MPPDEADVDEGRGHETKAEEQPLLNDLDADPRSSYSIERNRAGAGSRDPIDPTIDDADAPAGSHNRKDLLLVARANRPQKRQSPLGIAEASREEVVEH